MGITIIQKSDLTHSQEKSQGRAGAGGRRRHRRRVQARRAQGPRRLPGQSQDDRLRPLCGPERRRPSGGAAGRRRPAVRDAARARRVLDHRLAVHAAPLLQPELRRAAAEAAPNSSPTSRCSCRARCRRWSRARRISSTVCARHCACSRSSRRSRRCRTSPRRSCARSSPTAFPLPHDYLPSGLFDNSTHRALPARQPRAQRHAERLQVASTSASAKSSTSAR